MDDNLIKLEFFRVKYDSKLNDIVYWLLSRMDELSTNRDDEFKISISISKIKTKGD